jgi:hypothetical protein
LVAYLSARSSSEAIFPSCRAMPTAIETIDFAIEFETKRWAGVRSYW